MPSIRILLSPDQPGTWYICASLDKYRVSCDVFLYYLISEDNFQGYGIISR